MGFKVSVTDALRILYKLASKIKLAAKQMLSWSRTSRSVRWCAGTACLISALKSQPTNHIWSEWSHRIK